MPDRSEVSGPRPSAVLLDALGTTVALDPPAPRLAAALGVDLDDRLREAVREEMRHYRSHAVQARDAGSLAALRERCAAIVAEGIGRAVPVDALMAAISFRSYPDAVPAIERMRAAGLRIACVSNWDCGLPDVLERVGLLGLFDAVVTSAEVGVAKPHPRPFEVALERLGVTASDAVHVGDTQAEDVAGATAAGIEAVLIDRGAERDPTLTIASLGELADELTAPGPDRRS